MKQHTTNYYDTFIQVADDCPAEQGTPPLLRGGKRSIANYQYDLLKDHPYRYTSDDLFFEVFARRKDLPAAGLEAARRQFFAKGQPCFRASPLTKTYGWGVHCDGEGRIALYGRETEAYERFSNQEGLTVVKAMRSRRK